MFRLAPLAVFLLFLPVSFAQRNGQTPLNPNATASCHVSGEVVDAVSGQPLRNISLYLYPLGAPQVFSGTTITVGYALSRPGGPPQSYAARSDPGGQFVFPGVPPGEYTLRANGNDYPLQTYGQRDRFTPPKPLKVAPGQSLENIRFALEPGVVITGRVVDADGDAVESASVQAILETRFAGNTSYPVRGRAQTNDLGEYRIFGLAAGKYYVAVNPGPSQRGVAATGETVYAPEYYPGTTDPASAATLDTKPGDMESGIDFVLTPVQPGRVSGQVTGAPTNGDPRAPRAFVVLVPNSSAGPSVSQALGSGPVRDAQGHFQIDNVPPGSYMLVAQSFRRGRGPSMAELPVVVGPGQDLQGIELTLTSGNSISGTVAADPSPEFEVSSLFIALTPAGPGYRFGGGGVRVGKDGTFSLTNVFPGKYRLRVSGVPPQYYVKSSTLNGQDVLDGGVTVLAGAPPGTLAISLGLDGGALTGSVSGKDGKPLNDAAVVLIPDPPRRDRDDLYKLAHTNAMGQFTIQGIAPGSYKVFSCDNVENEEYRDPDFIKQYEDQGQSVQVTENGRQNVQLELIPMAAPGQ